jgi:chitin disaccharide deacetylase
MTSPLSSLNWVCTADDFGIGLATSRGIIRAHLQGPVTATSLMTTTGDHVRQSIPLLESAPRLEVGLHLVLTGGQRPLTNLAGSGMVDRNGMLLSNGRLWMCAWTGRINRPAVFDEICAQADAFRQLTGRKPAYVDGHHHAHQLPNIRDAVMEAMAKGLLPALTRKSVEPPGTLGLIPSSPSQLRRRAATALGRSAGRAFARHDIWCNDFYIGMLSKGDLRSPFPWARFLENATAAAGVIEWVMHPGEFDSTLEGRDVYVNERELELRACTDPANRGRWEHLQAALTTKSALWRQQHVGC